MNSIIEDGYADISNLLDTDNSWFNEGDDFFATNRKSQPYVVSVPDSGVIGGLPMGGTASLGFSGDVYSMTGYKRDSRDVNRPYNLIPSGNISMRDVDFPVWGIDNLGNSEMMYPENDYSFEGTEVLEIPIKQKLNNY
tara:strand:+ start:4406 stop:4819 length:414 start_codon:yes stop_codon:yes gene_type:complete